VVKGQLRSASIQRRRSDSIPWERLNFRTVVQGPGNKLWRLQW
jgi:hypothetical protein